MRLRTLIGSYYILYRLRSGRGSTYLSEIEGLKNAFQSGGVIVLLISAYFHILVPLWVLPVAWLVQKLVEFILGYLDEKYLGWWKQENNYVTSNVNPFWAEMNRKLDEINNKLDKP